MTNQDIAFQYTDLKGEEHEVVVSRVINFRAYDEMAGWDIETSVGDGLISYRAPEELKSPQYARVFASMLLAAADELERQNED